MTVLPNMGLTLPTRGPSGAGIWDDTVDANYALEDAHDHTTGKGVRVPVSGLNINADIAFSSLYAPTQLHRLQFSAIASAGLTGSNNKSLFVSDGTSGLTANELYWRNNTGTHVRLTNGNALNVAAFVGGIGGDYTSVSAALNYDDSGQRYTFKQGGGTTWARLASSDLRLFEHGSTDSVYVGQAAPAALAVSYTMTWPTALPGSDSFVKISNAGQLSFAAPVAATPVLYQHAIGLATLADATAHIDSFTDIGPTPPLLALMTSTGVHTLNLDLPIGTLSTYSVRLNKSSASGTITVRLYESASNGTGAPTQIGATQSNSANNPGDISMGQTGLSHAMTAGRSYWIAIKGGGTTGDIALGFSATVTVG